MSVIQALRAERDKYASAIAAIDTAIAALEPLADLNGDGAATGKRETTVSLKPTAAKKKKADKPKSKAAKPKRSGGTKKRVPLDEVKRRVVSALKNGGTGGMTARDLESATDTNYVAVRKAIDDLSGIVEQVGEGRRNMRFGLVNGADTSSLDGAGDVDTDDDGDGAEDTADSDESSSAGESVEVVPGFTVTEVTDDTVDLTTEDEPVTDVTEIDPSLGDEDTVTVDNSEDQVTVRFD